MSPPPAPVRVRDLEPADVPAVTALVVEVLAEFGFTAKVGGVAEDLRAVRERYGAGEAGFWVAEREGVVVGTVAIRPKEGRTCELKRLYLRPSERGSGLGQRLYDHAETFARRAGYERVWLDSSRRFARAHRLYRRNGFVLVESLDNDWEDDVYEKALLPVTPA
ncbi:MAG TPA: GNAT family N-acetyltransferase [Polyangiaceae bacterium]|nr:GNAT family N-acetyltransferase [Polyangiaceae bacterium]